jgi:murein DD-endopeptidase MepM/ murein hydrolase activator NlpD
MARSFYTFIIVPDASSRLRKLKLSAHALHVLAAIGLVIFFLAVGLGFSYMRMAFKAADYDKLQAENTSLKIQKKNLEVAAVKLGEKLSNIENLFANIQSLVENDSLTKRGKLMPGVGGSRVDYSTAQLLGSANLKDGIELLKDRTTEMESQLTILQELAQKKATMRRITPTIWPVKGNITSSFGSRTDPFNGEATELHLGMDISALFGTQVHAPADGVVIYAQRKAAYGNLIIINHGNGLTTRLGHLSRFNVKVGQKVGKNDVVGYVGTSGRSTAPHLHYEVRLNDRPLNPRNYLPRG